VVSTALSCACATRLRSTGGPRVATQQESTSSHVRAVGAGEVWASPGVRWGDRCDDQGQPVFPSTPVSSLIHLPRLATRTLRMARHTNYETQLHDFHAQGYAQRTMASILNLSLSTVAKRLTKLGLSAPVDPPPRVSPTRRPQSHPEIPTLMLNDLRELVDWWRGRREALQPSPDASRKTARVTFQVEQRWLEAIRRQDELDGTTMTQVINQAFQAFFAKKST